jgi:superfamily II DNA or RNA helicase
MRPLYPVQETHKALLMKALAKHNAALDASSTGTGKTLVGSQIAVELERPPFVVCMKSSIPMWKRELADRGIDPLGVINYELLRRGKTKFGSWSGRIWDWRLPKDSLVVWDEVQNCQGLATQNSKMLLAAKPYTNLMLSATAAEDPTEMRSLGFILGLHRVRDFWSWCKLNGCTPGMFGGLEFGGLGIDTEEILAKLHYRIFPEHGSRLSVNDLRDHFQETQIITTPVEFGKEIKAIYAEMEAELANLNDIINSDDDSGAEGLVAMLRARQKAELCKVPVIIQMAEDLIREGRSVVIFVNFNATIEALEKRLVGFKVISGRAKEDRQTVIDEFQADVVRGLIVNGQAGGVSVSLHDLHGNHPRTAIISPSFNAKQILQTLGRVHRAGGKTPSQQHILFAAGTIEEKVEAAVRAKMRHIEIFNEGKQDSTAKIIADARKRVDIPPEISETKSTVTKETKPAAPAPAMPEAEHAEFNPSSLGMFEKCPGFRNRQGDTEQSLKGTRIHKALEQNEIDDLPDDERPLARKCQDFIDGIVAERLPVLPTHDYREVKLTMDLGADLSTFGTCDRLIIYDAFGYMIDYKSGRRLITDASQNAQAFAYVIGAFQRFPELQEIHFFFLIPNRDEISEHLFKRSDIPEMQLRLSTIIRRAMAADYVTGKNFSPQPELCEYCSMQAVCPAVAKKALKIGSLLADGLPVPSNILVSKARPDDIPHLLRLAPLMEEWAKVVRAEALKLNLEEGQEIDGFVRQERKVPRAITSVNGAWKVAKEYGLPFEEFLDACSKVSMPKLEDIVAEIVKKSGKGTKKSARQELENKLRHADLLRQEGSIYYLREDKK